mmetsp:Transcript_15602/g.22623  ORF Transcript_15602/g.22623 Transcript_15602/m.22623 type:complete len:212 (-) Transcript_15602:6-641(-)
MSNHVYYEKFKDNIMTAERLGGQIGVHEKRIDKALIEIAANPRQPSENEIVRAKAMAKDKYLAVCFIMNSDRRRYGALIRDIENEHTRGTNSYPETLTAAYDYLVNYKTDKSSTNDSNEGGLAFHNEHERSTNRGEGRGSGRGRGRGRGDARSQEPDRAGRTGRGGRGRGRTHAQSRSTPAANNNEDNGENAQDHAQFLIDSSDNLEGDES